MYSNNPRDVVHKIQIQGQYFNSHTNTCKVFGKILKHQVGALK